jgi:Polysaccharide lyase
VSPTSIGSGGIAACLLLSVGVACSPPGAPAGTERASACGASLHPAWKKVRPRGRVRLSGEACARGKITIQQGKNGSWLRLGRTRADRGGAFSACVRLRGSAGRRKLRLRAVTGDGARAWATLRISKRGRKGCRLHLLRQDPATDPDPYPLWGDVDAVSPTRHQWFSSGGPDGGPFRRLTARDGDLYHGNSERAELGNSSYLLDSHHRLKTFYLYRAGMRRVTSYWMRLPTSFPISTDDWQVVMQMKQSEPATNADGTPVIALQATHGRWVLKQSASSGLSEKTRVLWSAPAEVGVWTRVVVDATYSTDPKRGRFKITVGSASSPVIHTYTLKRELSPPGEGLRPGDPIPSHLRLGIYHDPVLPGTSVDISKVRVLG